MSGADECKNVIKGRATSAYTQSSMYPYVMEKYGNRLFKWL